MERNLAAPDEEGPLLPLMRKSLIVPDVKGPPLAMVRRGLVAREEENPYCPFYVTILESEEILFLQKYRNE
jgi:hypothetical protein